MKNILKYLVILTLLFTSDLGLAQQNYTYKEIGSYLNKESDLIKVTTETLSIANDNCNNSFPSGIDGSFESCEPIAGQVIPNGQSQDGVGCSGWSTVNVTPDTWKFPLNIASGTVFSQNIIPSPNGGVFAGAASKAGESFQVTVANLEVGKKYALKFYQSHGTSYQSSLPQDYTRWKLSFGDEVKYSDDILITEFPQWELQYMEFTAVSEVQELILQGVVGEQSSNAYGHLYSLIDGIEFFEVQGDIVATNTTCINQNINFVFNSDDSQIIDSYSWVFYNTDGVNVLHTSSLASPSYTYLNNGTYNISLEVTYNDTCISEFSQSFTIEQNCNIDCNQYSISDIITNQCSNSETANEYCLDTEYCFSLEFANAFPESEILSQNFSISNSSGSTIYNSVSSLPNFIFQLEDTYSIDVTVFLSNGCVSSFQKSLIVENCNPCDWNAQLDIIPNSGGCGINDNGIPVDSYCIGEKFCFYYDFVNPDNSPYDVSWVITDPNQNVYQTDTSGSIGTNFIDEGVYTINLSITHINSGCVLQDTLQVDVLDCDPCQEVAVIVDESGSISEDEASQLRAGLQQFIDSQLDSGLNISIIGMSNQDTNQRTDHIGPEKVTSATKPVFDNWINNYGNREGQSGIDGNSDYWASAISLINNNPDTYDPDLVVIFTDGSQASDVDALKAEINTLRNNTDLYVYAIDNEYYVNGAGVVAQQNPNSTNTPVTLNNVVGSIRTSLNYLFEDDPLTIGVDESIPEDGLDNLASADYHGYADFSALSSGVTVLSNLFSQSGIECAVPVEECYDCYTFQPQPGETYWISAWAKEDLNVQVKTYEQPELQVKFFDNNDLEISTVSFFTSGNIIEGWQRIAGQLQIPINTVTLDIRLVNNSPNIPVFFDDVRLHPVNGSMKSYVYDPITYRLMAELDENNYKTAYEYGKEGELIRVKKETSRGIKTIQETRSGNKINQK